jgi:hypothetical protein
MIAGRTMKRSPATKAVIRVFRIDCRIRRAGTGVRAATSPGKTQRARSRAIAA